MVLTDFNKAFDFFTDLIRSDKNFAYARYADGEVALMKGNPIGNNSQAYVVDNWAAPPTLTKVGKQLLETLNHTESNYYYAISSDTDWKDDSLFLRSRLTTPNITFANLWINANYQKMKKFYTSLNKEVYLICNEKASKNVFPFTVAELFPFPNNCVHYWENFGDDYIKSLLEYTSNVSDKTFFISAGPVSEILIHKMFESNPNNQYLDVGSSIDEYVHGTLTRPYMNPESPYSKEVSYFYE
jgi:hypothetical protein